MTKREQPPNKRLVTGQPTVRARSKADVQIVPYHRSSHCRPRPVSPPWRVKFSNAGVTSRLEGVTLRVGEQTNHDRRYRSGSCSFLAAPGHREPLTSTAGAASRPGQVYGVFEVGIEVKSEVAQTSYQVHDLMPEIDTENALFQPLAPRLTKLQ